MGVCDLCSDAVVTTGPDMPVAEAAALVRECGVKTLVVVESDGVAIKPIGTADAADLGVAASRLSQYGVTVGDVMNRRLVTCRWDDTLPHALDLMRATSDGMILVLNDQSGFCGVLTPAAVRGWLVECMSHLRPAAETIASP